MLKRSLTSKLISLYKQFPIVAVLGPRQSGKTTLVRSSFPDLPYFNMENPSHLSFALEEPDTFLNAHKNGMIIDEVQRAPQLFSYLQVISDERNKPGQFILIGSHNILLNEKISQSLAGRVALTTLLPLSLKEIDTELTISEAIFKGFYPRLYANLIDPLDFYPNYINTYVEKDVRQIKNVTDLSQFQKFMRLCAGRVGQVFNVASLARDCGITAITANQWLSILEMSFIIFRLQPHHQNYNKRLVKAPKLYFYDTGIAANLLGINDQANVEAHFAKGCLFENMIISDLIKQVLNQGRQPHFYYWRDKVGHEIDLIIEDGDNVIPIEIKSGKTINSDFFKNINYWKNISHKEKAFIIYGGNEEQRRSAGHIISWQKLDYLNLVHSN
jgi:uncharacterized protein